MDKKIRWKQRFQNFKRAFHFLKEGVQLSKYDNLQAAGLIQTFEFSFELAWKTLKDFLESEGIDANFPREVIKHAFASNLIEDGPLWIAMLDKRNELSHTYNDKQATKAINLIKEDYFPAIQQVYLTLESKEA